MSNVSRTIKFRRRQQAKELHSPWKWLGLFSGLLVSLLIVLVVLAGLWFYINLTRNLPSVELLPSLLEPPNGSLLHPTRLYDRTHEHVILTLENPAAADKQYLQVGKSGQESGNQASKYLINATIAELDPGFWSHGGYTLNGISAGTHTTLAQMLVSNLVLEDEPLSLSRNIRERMLAAQVTAKYGREKILEWYINSAQYGDLIYGADAAARVYFSTSATDLSLAQATMLTAIAETPGINPLSGSQILKNQQELIISRLLVDGYVTAYEAQQALKEEVQFQSQVKNQPIAPMFTNLVLKQLSSIMPLERLYRGGYEIITSLDYGLQLQSICATQAQIARIQGNNEQIVTSMGAPCEADQLLPTIQTATGKSFLGLRAEVEILDPATGQILAFVGDGGSNLVSAYPAPHPAGSILTPFLYLTAFTRGMSPASLLWDIPVTDGSGAHTLVQSELLTGLAAAYHGPVSLRKAFTNDYYGATADVLQQVGIENVWLTEKQLGISRSEPNPGSKTDLEDLLSQPITLLDSVQAYSVLVNQGSMAGQPGIDKTAGNSENGLNTTSILSVVGVDGRVWLDWTKPQVLPVVNPQIAYLVTNVLSDEKARWPSLGHPNALEIGRSAGGKVSLTADGNDAMTIGYIPQLVIGVWMGRSQGEGSEVSVDMPAGLWHAIMQYASSQMQVQDFIEPPGISRVQVCDPSGILVSPLCQTIVQEIFLTGNEPVQTDDLYQKFYIDRETGLLATVFTPSSLVDEKVFLVVPPKAITWAKETGLLLPPDTYDSVSIPLPSSENVQFSNPKMFDNVGGLINFIGSAGGEDFSYYRIQVGQGLNPQQWLQIGEDVTHPVINGLLGTWDTKGLEDIYIVELMVVRKDLRIDRALLEVTVDNTTPQVEILTPKDKEQFVFEQGKKIIMNVSVSDKQAVQKVDYYVDNKLVSTLYEPTFIILWDSQVGGHTLQVKAIDLAGNQSIATVTFFVVQK
jgi:membrane peptidoglycan carboxypeptidase